jgi:hypothetical protein
MVALRSVGWDLKAKGIKVVPTELEGVFRRLEKLGVGKLQKKGQLMSFQWKDDMRAVSIAALGENLPSQDRRTSMAYENRHHKDGVRELDVMLGPNRGAHISIPEDLSEEEAEFLFNTLMRKVSR